MLFDWPAKLGVSKQAVSVLEELLLCVTCDHIQFSLSQASKTIETFSISFFMGNRKL